MHPEWKEGICLLQLINVNKLLILRKFLFYLFSTTNEGVRIYTFELKGGNRCLNPWAHVNTALQLTWSFSPKDYQGNLS